MLTISGPLLLQLLEYPFTCKDLAVKHVTALCKASESLCFPACAASKPSEPCASSSTSPSPSHFPRYLPSPLLESHLRQTQHRHHLTSSSNSLQWQQQQPQQLFQPLAHMLAAPPSPAVLRWQQHQQQGWLMGTRQGQHQFQQHRSIKSKVQVEYQIMKEPKGDTYSGEPKNYIQLLCALKYAPSVDRIQHLVNTYIDRFDGTHVSAALARLPKTARFRESDLVKSSISSVSSTCPTPDVSVAATANTRTRRLPVGGAQPRRSYQEAAAPLAAQLLQMVQGQTSPDASLPVAVTSKRLQKGLITRFTERNVANCMWAMGALHHLGVQVPFSLREKSINAMLSVFSGKQGKRQGIVRATDLSMRNLDIAQLVNGLSKLQVRPDKPNAQRLLRVLAAQSARNARHFTARDLQMALHGFKFLGYASPALVNAMARRITQIPRDFVPQGISTLMRLLAPPFRPSFYQDSALQSLPSPPALKDRQAAGSALTPAAAPLPAELQGARLQALQCLAAGVAPQVVSMTHDDLAGIAAAVAGIGAAYRRHAEGASSSSSSSSSSPGTRDATGSVPFSGIPEWVTSLAQLLCRRAAQHVQELQTSQLAAVLDMVGVLGMHDSQVLQAVVDGVLVEQQIDPKLPVSAAVSMIHSFAVLGLLEPSAAAAAQQEPTSTKTSISESLSEVQHTLPPRPLSLLPTAHRVRGDGLGAPESTLLYKLRNAPLHERASVALNRVLSVYTAHGAVQLMGPKDVSALAGALASLHNTSSSTTKALATSYQPLLAAITEQAEALLLPTNHKASPEFQAALDAPSSSKQEDPTQGEATTPKADAEKALANRKEGRQVEDNKDRATWTGRGIGGKFRATHLLHLLRSLRAMDTCELQLALAAVTYARDGLLVKQPASLPLVIEIIAEACAGGAPSDVRTATALSKAYINAMANAHNVSSTESGLVTPHIRHVAEGDRDSGNPNLSLPQLGQLLALVESAGCMSDDLLEAALEQLLQQLPGSDSRKKVGKAAAHRRAARAPETAHALVQCLRVCTLPAQVSPSAPQVVEKKHQDRWMAAVLAMHYTLLNQGLLAYLSPEELQDLLRSATEATSALGRSSEDLISACKQRLAQQS